jgi:hypothetical protein
MDPYIPMQRQDSRLGPQLERRFAVLDASPYYYKFIKDESEDPNEEAGK